MVLIVEYLIDTRFLESSHAEIEGLIDRGTYVAVNENNLPPGANIMRSRGIHSIKKDSEENEKCKARLVILGHLDPENGRVVNEAPTILRSSTRIILTLASSLDLRIRSRDVKQAFIQSEDPLHRELYVKPPKRPNLLAMINQPPGLLPAVKLLYGLSESPGYWWQTFKRHHVTDLGMTQTILDPCLFFEKKESELIGLIGTLVDDKLGTGSEDFANEEETRASKFDVKPRDESLPMLFGGSQTSKIESSCLFSQQNYSITLEKISPKDFSPDAFAHLRGQLAYVATSTRPDLAYINAKLAQVPFSRATADDVRLLNSAVKVLKENPRGLTFPK